MNIYLHIVLSIHIGMTVEILSHVRQLLTRFTQSISWLLMTYRPKEQGIGNHDILLCGTRLIRSLHDKVNTFKPTRNTFC